MKLNVNVNNQVFEVEIKDLSARPVIAVIDGQVFEVWPDKETRLPQPAAAVPVAAVAAPAPAPVSSSAQAAAAKPVATGSPDKTRVALAPIPGVIVTISVKAGDTVENGKELCVLEAMKMKNSIRATRVGKIAAVHITVGQQVKSGQVLVEFEG